VTARILDAITEDTDVLMLCSPNNPTGRCVEQKLLSAILGRCRETGTWLFLDECFTDLCDADKSFSLAGSIEKNDRVLLLHAFTKTYGMAGVRLGYAISKHAALLLKMSETTQPWNVSSLAQAAGLAALGCGDWVEKTRALLAEEKPYLIRALKKLGVQVLEGDANYLLLSGVPGLFESLLRRGILIRNCENYHGLSAGDCRVAVRTHEENETLIAVIREVSDARNGN